MPIDFTNLDPQVVTLAKGVRTVESNNTYTKSNPDAGGWSVGAYQWNGANEQAARAHFQSEATQFGLNPNDFSPINQDKVAYAKMKTWKDEGYHAGEIAAMWNGSHLENGRPVANHPDYITKVQKALGQTQSPNNGQLNPQQKQSDSAPQGAGYLPITPITNKPTPPTQAQINPSASNKVLNTGNTVAGALGMQPFGQGLATAGREIAGHGNDEGDAEGAAAKQLSDIMAKYPVGSPQRKSAIQKYLQLYSGGVPTEADIDPGTTLSNKDVLKSAGATGLLALAGGSLPAEGVAEESGATGLAKSFMRTPSESANNPLLLDLAKGAYTKAAPVVSKVMPYIKGVTKAGATVALLKELMDIKNALNSK